jgi:hypothetical protein
MSKHSKSMAPSNPAQAPRILKPINRTSPCPPIFGRKPGDSSLAENSRIGWKPNGRSLPMTQLNEQNYFASPGMERAVPRTDLGTYLTWVGKQADFAITVRHFLDMSRACLGLRRTSVPVSAYQQRARGRVAAAGLRQSAQ